MNRSLASYTRGVEGQWQDKVAETHSKLATAIAANDTSHRVEAAVETLTAQAEQANKASLERKRAAENNLRGMEEEGDQYEAQVHAKLDTEMKALDMDTNSTQGLLEANSGAYAKQLETGLVPDLHAVVDTAEKLSQTDRSATKEELTQLEVALAAASQKDLSEYADLHNEVQSLALKHAELSQFTHTFRVKDLAWKEAVESKFRDLGVRINSTALAALTAANEDVQKATNLGGSLGADVEKEMTAIEARQSRALSALYAKQDEQLEEIYNDEALSEEQRAQKVKEIQQATRNAANEIFAEQARMREKQEEMEHALNRYEALVDAAAADTDRAIAEGHLAPSARAVEQNLAAVGREIEKLRYRPWLHGSSFAEEHHEHKHP